MQSLEEMRKELDVIDDQITTLYERRMKVCEMRGRRNRKSIGYRTDERYLIRQERTRNWQQ